MNKSNIFLSLVHGVHTWFFLSPFYHHVVWQSRLKENNWPKVTQGVSLEHVVCPTLTLITVPYNLQLEPAN